MCPTKGDGDKTTEKKSQEPQENPEKQDSQENRESND